MHCSSRPPLSEMSGELELIACQPHPIESNGFNPNATLPYDFRIEHILLAMNNFVEFLGFINQQLYSQDHDFK